MTHLGGHVGADETYEVNAQKELAEEGGIQVQPQELVHWRTTKIPSARVWVGEYVVLKDLDVEKLVPQPGEVERFAWMTVDEILKDAQQNPSNWCAGTHNFFVEYHCLRAALTAAKGTGAIQSAHPIHAWHPVSLAG
jgi:8-oxo-dGTP pyrophosphatase MutT (NUDIX family)